MSRSPDRRTARAPLARRRRRWPLGVPAGRRRRGRRRRPDDGRRGSSSRATPGSDRGWPIEVRPQQRRPAGHRRAAAAGRRAGRDPVRRAGRPARAPPTRRYVLYAQPPSFGQQLEVVLVDRRPGRRRARRSPSRSTMPTQLDRRRRRRAARRDRRRARPACRARTSSAAPSIAARPGRPARAGRGLVRARSPRLAGRRHQHASPPASSRPCAAGSPLGGRLVIVGGTAGPGVLSGFPDDILPYRPTDHVDVAPASLTRSSASCPTARPTSRRSPAS